MFFTTADFNELYYEIYRNRLYVTSFRTEGISENITWCNLFSHGLFLQAQLHIITAKQKDNVIITTSIFCKKLIIKNHINLSFPNRLQYINNQLSIGNYHCRKISATVVCCVYVMVKCFYIG